MAKSDSVQTVSSAVTLDLLSIPPLDFLSWHRLADERYIAVRFLECVDAATDLFVRRECVLEIHEGDVYPYTGDAIDEDTLDEVRADALGKRPLTYWDCRAENRAWAGETARAL